MAAGTTIKHKRKAGAFVNGELAAGEFGVDVSTGLVYLSVNGTTVQALSVIVAALDDVGDVVITSVADNHLLAYDSGTSKFTNQTAAQAGVIAAAEKGAVSGVATLDSGGKIPSAQLPAIAVGETFTVGSQAAMLALTAQIGDVAIRTDLSNARFLLTGTSTVLADWKTLEIPATAVSSVFSRTGAIVAATNDYTATQIQNTSGVAGTGVAAALDTLNAGKAALSHVHAGTDITSGNIPTAAMQTNVAAALQAGSGTVSNPSLVIDGGTI
jgi:hypothetical protein